MKRALFALLIPGACLAAAADRPRWGERVLERVAEYRRMEDCDPEVENIPVGELGLIFTKGESAFAEVNGALKVLLSNGVVFLPPSLSRNDIMLVIEKYVKDHPDEWDQLDTLLIQDALIAKWPGPNAQVFKALRRNATTKP